MADRETFKILGNFEALEEYRNNRSEEDVLIIPVCMILKAIEDKNDITENSKMNMKNIINH